MTKAFTRESDDGPGESMIARPLSSLPAGVKNYVTPKGAQSLREELDRIVQQERPRVAGAKDHDTPHRLQVLDQQIRHLQHSLETAVIVSPPPEPWENVRFGATVKVRNRRGAEESYRIVGVDEADPDKDWVSWLSPIARALINARIGERVRFKFPAGEDELEILQITYE